MLVKLKSVAAVQMGYSFRSRLDTSTDADVAVIQMKDLKVDNTVDCDNLVRVEMDSVKEHHFVRVGDLVFRSRGQHTTSAILLEDAGNAVVAAPLFRLRVTSPDKVLPEFLNWYISQKDAQIFFASRVKGSGQKMISKQAVEELEVMIPSLECQRSIVELARLSDQEQFLLHQLAIKREQYISKVLINAAKGGVS